MLLNVDCLMFYVPDLDEGIAYYGTKLGLALAWRTADSAGLLLRDGKTEIVIQTREPKMGTDVKVDSVERQVEEVVRAGGKVVVRPFDIPIGKCAVVADPWGNRMVILDSSKGTYRTDPDGNVVGIATPQPQQ
jgi:predicted enzyme related to lactoylglutathione lyase